jgi:iron-sulfur cluster repair protein YtfE (RIC family)
MMPISISSGGRTAARATDAVDDLRLCHGRIRHHLELAQRTLEESPRASAEEIAEAAADVARYFTIALPLHAADEDDSMRPRLEAAPVSREVRQLLHRMSTEHGVLHEIVDEVAPLWREVASQPALRRQHRLELGTAVAELDTMFERHLQEEEEILFPALRRFVDPAELAEMRREMRARR